MALNWSLSAATFGGPKNVHATLLASAVSGAAGLGNYLFHSLSSLKKAQVAGCAAAAENPPQSPGISDAKQAGATIGMCLGAITSTTTLTGGGYWCFAAGYTWTHAQNSGDKLRALKYLAVGAAFTTLHIAQNFWILDDATVAAKMGKQKGFDACLPYAQKSNATLPSFSGAPWESTTPSYQGYFGLTVVGLSVLNGFLAGRRHSRDSSRSQPAVVGAQNGGLQDPLLGVQPASSCCP